jgi:hypothetical protein
MEAIWKKEYSLAEFLDPSQFKSYDELKKRLDYTLGLKGTPKFQDQETIEEEENFRRDNRGESTNFGASPDFNAPDITHTSTTEEDDDAMSYFARLAEE